MSLTAWTLTAEMFDEPTALVDIETLEVAAANEVFYLWREANAGGGGFAEELNLDTRARLLELSQTELGFELASEGRFRNGRTFPGCYRFRQVSYNEKVYLLLTGRDVSKLKQKDDMVASFTKMIDTNNRQLRRQKRSMADLLNNMQQAVFAVSPDLVLVEPVSKFTAQIFGDNALGQKVDDLLYSQIEAGSPERSLIDTTLGVVFGEDDVQWLFMEDNLPREVTFVPCEGDASANTKHLRISYSPIWSDDDLLEKILFVVEDYTDVRALEEQVANERNEKALAMNCLQEMAELRRDELQEALQDAWDLLSEARAKVAGMLHDPANLEIAFRHLHTLKGNARMQGMSLLSGRVHQVETGLSVLRDQAAGDQPLTDLDLSHLRDGLDAIEAEGAFYASLAARVFGLEDVFARERLLSVHKELLRWRRDQLVVSDAADIVSRIAISLPEALLAALGTNHTAEAWHELGRWMSLQLAQATPSLAQLVDLGAAARALSKQVLVAGDTRVAQAHQLGVKAYDSGAVWLGWLCDNVEAIGTDPSSNNLDPWSVRLEKCADWCEGLETPDGVDDLAEAYVLGFQVGAMQSPDDTGVASSLPQTSTVLFEVKSRLLQLADQGVLDPEAWRQAVSQIELLPVGLFTARYQKLVAELSRSLGKKADLVLSGLSVLLTPVQRGALHEALVHMLRNALDHGLELPDERVGAGKPSRGTIALDFSQRDGQVIVSLRDDGPGIDHEQVLGAWQKRSPKSTDVCALDRTEALQLVFQPGLTTAAQLSEISGRGVGLDVVSGVAKKLGGSVRVDSQIGTYTQFDLVFPVFQHSREAEQ